MRPLEVNELPHCANCGQLMTWDTSVMEMCSQRLNFCGEKCLEVFNSYLIPVYSETYLNKLDETCFSDSIGPQAYKKESSKTLHPPKKNLSYLSQNKTDPFLLEIIRNYFVSTCEEMGASMMRTAFSTLFSEARDFIVVMLDEEAELLAQVDYVPSMLGAARHAIKLCLFEVGVENLAPGDIILSNDPYRNNGHIPEHIMVKPIFQKEKIIGYTGCICHMVDVGGSVPAAFGIHENCYQEGLRIPPVKIYENNQEVVDNLKLILANTRLPKSSYGDFKAMIGALYRGEKRILQLIDRYDYHIYSQACHDIKSVSEQLMRKQIASWPNGTYEISDYFESDGITPERSWQLKCKLQIRNHDLIVDLSGSDEPPAGSMAMTFGSSSAAVYIAIFQMVDNVIPINEGCYRCITVISPYGTLTNTPHPHASMAGHSEGQPILIDMLLRAFAKFSDQSAAPDANSCGLVSFGGIDPRNNTPFAYLNLEGTGWGASKFSDGNSVQFTKLGNCSVQTIDSVETRYPFIHLEYELQPFRGGAGKYRGGFGSRRRIKVFGHDLVASTTISRTILSAPGLQGGGNSAVNMVSFRSPNENNWKLATEKFGSISNGMFSNLKLKPNDEVLVITGNGAGYGNPYEREPKLVLKDVIDELLTIEQALQYFGVVVMEDKLEIDYVKTFQSRKEKG